MRITSCSRGGSVRIARCSASSPSATTTSSSTFPASCATRSPKAVSPSSPTALSSLANVLDVELRPLRDLCVGRRALELGHELALRARDLLLALDDVHGDANR